MVTIVLLKVERIWATPLGTFFLLLRGPVFRVGLAMVLQLNQMNIDNQQTAEKLATAVSELYL